jgi:hypothetical protein
MLLISSCVAYSILPKSISNHSGIEGIYSNISEIDTMKNSVRKIEGVYINVLEIDSLKHTAYKTRTIWSMVDRKPKFETDSIIVRVEIVNSKALRFSFLKNDEIVGTKRLKGKFKKNGCFYGRRTFIVIPILPVFWMYGNFQQRIYQVDDELVIEQTGNSGGVAIIMAGGEKYNDIWRFKRLEN